MGSYRIVHEWASRGYDRKTCWVHARAGAVPASVTAGQNPLVVMTMQKLVLAGSDDFLPMSTIYSRDRGRTWSAPVTDERMKWTDDTSPGAPYRVVPCDFWPAWHAASTQLLNIGHTAYYKGESLPQGPRPRQTVYTTYDIEQYTWSPARILALPDDLPAFRSSGAGCCQRVDLPNGEILLPMYLIDFNNTSGNQYRSTVVRCAFDGKELKYMEHGNVAGVPAGSGLVETSLTEFQGRYYINYRNRLCGYVAASDDGLHFDSPLVLRFENGEEVGTYNTQRHWVRRDDSLYMVYNRRGLNNAHVFRQRGPVLMAQFDAEQMCLLRDTERVLIPERGARIGNFGVTYVDKNEVWVTVAEWMQNGGLAARTMLEKLGKRKPSDPWPPKVVTQDYGPCCEAFGSENTVWVARLLWDEV